MSNSCFTSGGSYGGEDPTSEGHGKYTCSMLVQRLRLEIVQHTHGVHGVYGAVKQEINGKCKLFQSIKLRLLDDGTGRASLPDPRWAAMQSLFSYFRVFVQSAKFERSMRKR